MPDTMITTADVAKLSPQRKSLKVLLRDYRRTYQEYGDALRTIGEQNLGRDADRAAQEAAAVPNDAAREALIDAPVVSLKDIELKLRFYFEVGGHLKRYDEPESWEDEIVKNVLRDLKRMTGAKR